MGKIIAVGVVKREKGCQIEITKTKNGITFRCKKLKRRPNAQEIIDSLK